jgi:hypothetical protein
MITSAAADPAMDLFREGGDGLDSRDGTQNNVSAGELSELLGDIEARQNIAAPLCDGWVFYSSRFQHVD